MIRPKNVKIVLIGDFNATIKNIEEEKYKVQSLRSTSDASGVEMNDNGNRLLQTIRANNLTLDWYGGIGPRRKL